MQQPQAKESSPKALQKRDDVTVEELRNYLNSLRSGERQVPPRRPSPPRHENFLVREVGRTSNDAVMMSPRRPLTAQALSRHTGRPQPQDVHMAEDPRRSWDLDGRERPSTSDLRLKLPAVASGYRSPHITPRGANLRQARILSTLDIASPRGLA